MSEKNDVFDTAEPLHSSEESESGSKERIVMPEPEQRRPRRRGRPPGARTRRKRREPREPLVTCPAPFQDVPEPDKDYEEDMKKETVMTETPPLRRLWKSKRSLPSVEWDENAGTPDPKTGKPMGAARFEFRRGVFETRDQKLAEELIKRGYMEIPEGVQPPIGPPTDDLPALEEVGSPQQLSARQVFAAAMELAERRAKGLQ